MSFFYHALLISVFVNPCLSSLCAAEPITFGCAKSSGPIQIDGSLLDWDGSTPVHCDKDQQRQMPLFASDQDLAVKAYFAWDDTYFYLAVDVDDDIYCQNEIGSAVWQGDSIQCIFDASKDGQRPLTEYEIAMTKAGPIAVEGLGNVAGTPVKNLRLAISKKEANEGFVYEMAIPWKTLQIDPKVEKSFRFTFLANDNDGIGREGWIEWTPGIAGSKDPESFARITLDPGKESKEPVRGQLTFKKQFYLKGREVDCAAYIQSDLAVSGRLRFDILKHGTMEKSIPADVTLSKGLTKFSHSIDISGLDDGIYDVLIYMPVNGTDILIASSELKLVDIEKYKASIQRIRDQCASLNKLMDEGRAKNLDVSYIRLAKTVGDVFAEYAEGDLAAELYEDVENNTVYLSQMLDEALSAGTDFVKKPDQVLFVPDCDFRSLKIKNGSFYTKDDKPTMLVGPLGWWNEGDFPIAANIGFNVMSSEIGTAHVLPNETQIDEEGIKVIKNQIDLCRQNNLAFNLLLSIHYFPAWAYKKYPDIVTRGSTPQNGASPAPPESNNFLPVKLDDDRSRAIYEKYLTNLTPRIKSPDTLLALCLANEPIYFDYNDHDKEATEHFQRYLEEKYKTIAVLNGEWNTKYPDFAAASVMFPHVVAMPKIGEVTPGQWHDWMSFNQYRVTGFFSWMQKIIKENDGIPFTHVKVPGVTYYRSGVEGEAISDLCDLSGLDNGCEYSHKRYAFDFMKGMMAYDFYKSINPQKPVADTEMHFSTKANLPEEYFYAQLFLSYLHGLDLSGIWVWNRNLKIYRSILVEPKRMHGMGKAALDLRRLARYVIAFQNKKASIGILWSQSTFLSQRASEYRRALDEAYENIYFLNIPTNFVTEKRILDTKIADYKILLVPSAFYVKDEVFDEIQAFAERGGIVLLSGEGALSCNEYGRKRDISGLLQLHTVRELSDAKELYVEVKGDLEKAGIKRDIVLDVKTATNSGMADTVEYRSIVCDSRLICYAINLGKEKIKVALRDKDGKALTQSKDLISGRQFEGEIPLASMEVVMLDVGPAVKTE